jgi:hypothetical protein
LALAGVALAAGAVWLPGAASSRPAAQVRSGDAAARAGDLDGARAIWSDTWERGFHHPALAARLGWVELEAGGTGRAAAWALRGEGGSPDDPRDPGLVWLSDRVRESGGLTGERGVPLPLRPREWAALALAAGIAAGLVWPRRPVWAAAGLALAVACAVAGPAQQRLGRRGDRAVLIAQARLDGADVELEPGQVVTVIERAGSRVRVRVGRGIRGWLPVTAVERVREPS